MDRAVTAWLVAHRTDALTVCCRALAWFGVTIPGMVILLVVVVAACLVARRPRTLLATVIAVGVAVGVGDLVKVLVRRPRPPEAVRLVPAEGWSFPSTTAAAVTACAVVLAGLTWTRGPGTRGRGIAWRAFLAVAATLVCFAVIYLGDHWLGDVLAGAPLGAASALLVGAVPRWWRRHRRRAGEDSARR